MKSSKLLLARSWKVCDRMASGEELLRQRTIPVRQSKRQWSMSGTGHRSCVWEVCNYCGGGDVMC